MLRNSEISEAKKSKAIETSMKRLKKTVDEVESENIALRRRVAELDEEIVSLKKEKIDLLERTRALETENQKLKTKVDELQRQVDNLEKEKARLMAQISSLSEEMLVVHSENKALMSKVSSIEADFAKAKKEVGRLASEDERKTQQIRNLTEEVSELAGDVAGFQEAINRNDILQAAIQSSGKKALEASKERSETSAKLVFLVYRKIATNFTKKLIAKFLSKEEAADVFTFKHLDEAIPKGHPKFQEWTALKKELKIDSRGFQRAFKQLIHLGDVDAHEFERKDLELAEKLHSSLPEGLTTEAQVLLSAMKRLEGFPPKV